MSHEMPFTGQHYEVTKRISLHPVLEVEKTRLVSEMANMTPWKELGISAAMLSSKLAERHGDIRRFSIYHHDQLAGLVCLKPDWLFGPYVQILAILRQWQGRGIGSEILEWMERQATGLNLWLTVSSFNQPAITFYFRHGFHKVGELPDLVKKGFTELLLRKVLT